MVDLPKYIVRRNEHNHYCILFKLEYLRATQNGMLGQVVETLESTRERWVVLMSKSWGGGGVAVAAARLQAKNGRLRGEGFHQSMRSGKYEGNVDNTVTG